MELLIIVFAVSIAILFFILRLFSISVMIEALASGVAITPIELLAMRLRQVPAHHVVRAVIRLVKANCGYDQKSHPELIQIFEAHYLAGGNVDRVVAALVAAKRENVGLSLNEAMAKDLEIVGREMDE